MLEKTINSALSPEKSVRTKPDILDSEMTGQMLSQKCDLFAILQLSNGEKALLSNHRVWINDKPKFGGWRALYLDYFKTMNVNARQVSGFAEFSYQVSFCHTGMNKRNWQTRLFEYPENMLAWMKPMRVTDTMDKELTLYKSRHEPNVK